MVGTSGYRLRHLVALGSGLTWVGAYLGNWFVSPWAPLVVATLVGAGIGALVGEAAGGAAGGGYAVGLGGFLFVGVNFLNAGPVTAFTNALFTFVLFAVLGLVAGGLVGGVLAWRRGRGAEPAGTAEG
jgi:hypothetical protein